MSDDRDKTPPPRDGDNSVGTEEPTLPAEELPYQKTVFGSGDEAVGADEATLPAEDIAHQRTVLGSGEGAATTDVDEALASDETGRFELRKELGRGGIGRVLLAFDPKLGREVAIKELLPHHTSEQSTSGSGSSGRSARTPTEQRFLDEARITAQLDHPGIVAVHELGEKPDGRSYYVMRLVRGRTLSEALRKKPLAERLEVLPEFTELCHAVAYAHSRGVVHRDLKPENVMLGQFGETLVVDWGLAKVRGKKDRRMAALAEEMEKLRQYSGSDTVRGVALGTPAYMPPEQAAGDLDQIDERSDVYSLGAILYEVLCGRPPHLGRSVVELLSKVQEGDIKHPLTREPTAPPELAAVCLRALATSPDDRYASAKELAEDVRRFQVGKLVHAHRYGILELVGRWIHRHRIALGVVVAMLLLALGGYWYRGWTEAQTRREQERRRRARVAAQVDEIISDVSKGTRQKNWLDIYAFRLISWKEPLVEERLIASLSDPHVDVRRLAARALGGMKSRRAVPALMARLKRGVEPSETVVIAVINALGIIGDSRANKVVSRTRYRHGQKSSVWNNTKLAFKLIPLPPLPRQGVTAPQLVNRALDLANKGDLAAGIALLTRAIGMRPKHPIGYLNRAILRRKHGELKGALADYNKAITLDPSNMVTHVNRSRLRRRLRDYKGALADLDKVIRSGVRPELALEARARLHQDMGHPALAIPDYQAVLKRKPRRAPVYLNLAYAWRDMRRLDKSFAVLNKALEVHPRYRPALTVRAAVRQHRGDLAGALVDAERSVALDPEYLYAYTRRGQILLARGRRKEARADFDKAISLKPEHGWRWGARAIFYHYALGDFRRAGDDLREALKRAAKQTLKQQHLYRALLVAVTLSAGQPAPARSLLRGAKPSHPRSVEWQGIRFLRGEIQASTLQKHAGSSLLWTDYVLFLQGLAAELGGDLAAARDRYAAAVTRYRWSSLWWSVAAMRLRKLSPPAPKRP